MEQQSEILLYQTENGQTRIQVKLVDETVWLTLNQIAELFQKAKSTISEHINNIFDEGELDRPATVRKFRTVQIEGDREVTREPEFYNLDVIISVGYRVKSPRGLQFRIWATQRLKEYIVKGFVMDDARLKEPGSWDYFDELLERIRDIRASEKRFYQKVRDIYATAVDYDSHSKDAELFFKKVQNKMLWAVTGKTAPELMATRSDPVLPNMGLNSFKGARVRKHDVTTAKNYLDQSELDELNSIVVMYLDYAEDQAKRRKTMTMRDWEERLDAFLSFNEREVLTHGGKLRADVADKLVLERYEQFDASRRQAERIAADQEDMATLESLQKTIAEKKPRKRKDEQ